MASRMCKSGIVSFHRFQETPNTCRVVRFRACSVRLCRIRVLCDALGSPFFGESTEHRNPCRAFLSTSAIFEQIGNLLWFFGFGALWMIDFINDGASTVCLWSEYFCVVCNLLKYWFPHGFWGGIGLGGIMFLGGFPHKQENMNALPTKQSIWRNDFRVHGPCRSTEYWVWLSEILSNFTCTYEASRLMNCAWNPWNARKTSEHVRHSPVRGTRLITVRCPQRHQQCQVTRSISL